MDAKTPRLARFSHPFTRHRLAWMRKPPGLHGFRIHSPQTAADERSTPAARGDGVDGCHDWPDPLSPQGGRAWGLLAVTARWGLGPGVIELPDGRRVRGRSLRSPIDAGAQPDVGFYLLGREPAAMPWPSVWIRWPDFRLPADPVGALDSLRLAHRRCADERVEIACSGGKGRTGCALAVLAVLGGVEPRDAVAWVRRAYHPRAVETPWQRRWVRGLDPLLGSRTT